MTHLFKNNKGFTLIELLAVLALLSVVTLAGTQLFNASNNNNAKTSNMINQQQETNLLIQQIQSEYKNGVNDPLFNYNSLQYTAGDSIIISKLIANGHDEQLKGTIQKVDHNKPLHIELTTENDSGNKIHINTTFHPNNNKTIILK